MTERLAPALRRGLEWLRRPPRALPHIELGGRRLPVVIRRLAHARRLTLRLARDGSQVELSMPRWTPDAEGLAFAAARKDWLEAQLARLHPPRPLRPGDMLPVAGHMLRITHQPGATRQIRAGDGALVLGGPLESLEPRIKRWLQAEARRLLAADLADYATRAGVALPPLALSGAGARWGSCSSRGGVRINWRLVMAPTEVRRSVVAHEVTHLTHFNHSPAFHAALAALFEGDLAACDGWLKAHGRSLYAHFA